MLLRGVYTHFSGPHYKHETIIIYDGIYCGLYQGSLTEGEVSVWLTSLY